MILFSESKREEETNTRELQQQCSIMICIYFNSHTRKVESTYQDSASREEPSQ